MRRAFEPGPVDGTSATPAEFGWQWETGTLRMVDNSRGPEARQLECEHAMRERLEILIALAERTGWSRHEIALALMDLTENYAAGMNSETMDARRPALAAPARVLH